MRKFTAHLTTEFDFVNNNLMSVIHPCVNSL